MARTTAPIQGVEGSKAHIAELRRQMESEGFVHPEAYAVGVQTLSSTGEVIDTKFPMVNFFTTKVVDGEEVREYDNPGVAVLLADKVGYRGHGVMTAQLTNLQIYEVLEVLQPFRNDGKKHPNMDVLDVAYLIAYEGRERTQVVVTFIGDVANMAPHSASDASLRLHLLSHRRVQPHCVNLDGVFGILPNVVWTNHGPVAPYDFTALQLEVLRKNQHLKVYGVDKFPAMLDNVLPSGVRVGDGDRVRLGAHLAEGTTVMHEGFVNFNAGTLGESMVEGRISGGVVVGDGSDLGGSASIMGTLSGGGKETITVGKGCLLGANSGIGISLGDRCVVEAGAYITAGSRVLDIRDPNNPITVKASELSGVNDLLFRRNSVTGALEVLSSKGVNWGGLNKGLHQND